jgi:hypothetical protein
MARICPKMDSADLQSVPTKRVKNTQTTTIKSCSFFLLNLLKAKGCQQNTKLPLQKSAILSQ